MPISFNRVMLGKKSQYAAECFSDGFIGADFGIVEDLSSNLPEEWREFNKKYIPVLLSTEPGKSKVGAGLACGQLWTVAKGLQRGDVVLAPDGTGVYHVGRITSDYYYVSGEPLPHRRKVDWFTTINRSDMSDELKNATGSLLTTCNVTQHGVELERLIGALTPAVAPAIVSANPEIEDPSTFALETHLEDFLVKNWEQTILGQDYVIYSEDGEILGKQYPTDAGTIDILAVSKDSSRLLIVELKRGRASDIVVGQTLRYMGFVQEELAQEGQSVEGVIIGLEDDKKLRWALKPVPNIKSYRYKIDFKLIAN